MVKDKPDVNSNFSKHNDIRYSLQDNSGKVLKHWPESPLSIFVIFYIYNIHSGNNKCYQRQLLRFDDPFLTSKKDSQGVISRT